MANNFLASMWVIILWETWVPKRHLSFLNVFYFITILSMLSFYIELTFLICSFYITITLRVCVYLYSCVRKCYCACYFILCIELQIFFYCTFVLLSQQWLNKDAQSILNDQGTAHDTQIQTVSIAYFCATVYLKKDELRVLATDMCL